jgi:glycosyltransferase involved in cell wall biosynthesis
VNILLVTAMFPPINTGTSFYSRNLADALYAKGHGVTVVTLENPAAPAMQLPYSVHRLPAWHISAISFFKHFRVCSLFPRNYRRIAAIAKSHSVEAVVLVNHYLDIAFPAMYAARAASVPLVCSIGTQLQSSVRWRNWALNFLDHMICGRMIFPRCDRLVAWDREILRYLSDVQGPGILSKCSIINFGVNGDPAAFLSHQHDYRLHNQILAVGSVIRQRSYIPLI